MKKMNVFRQMLKIVWEYDKSYLAAMLAEILIYCLYPFVTLALTKYSVLMLTELYDYKHYLFWVILLLVTILILSLLKNAVTSFNNIKGNLIGQKLYYGILEKCLTLDYQDLQKKEILEKKELAFKAIDGGTFSALITNFKIIVGNILVVFGIILILMRTDWLILLITIIIVVLNGISFIKLQKKQYNADVEITPINREIGYYIGLSSDFAVAKEMRLFDAKKELLTKYNDLYFRTFNVLKKMFKEQKSNHNLNTITSFALESVIYIVLGMKVLVQKNMNISDFSLYAGAVRQFNSVLEGTVRAIADIDKNGSHLNDYFAFLNLESNFEKAKKDLQDTQTHTIRFDHVSYKYPGQDTYALKNITTTINPGEKISLVGENGSGKTTFIKLLTRLIEPTEGNIYIDNVDICEIEYKQYLNLFSTVFQDFHIYSFSVKENITMLKQQDNDSIIWENLDKVGLKEKVAEQSQGIQTILSRIFDDNGMELSGGQNQKLAIARAIYKNSEIIILDEPTASLDPKAEYEIFKNFDQLVGKNTAIYISHRLSTCKFSDHILVFANGEIVEHGKHTDLMKQKGTYAELFDMQAQFYN